jgi:dihydroxyacetone kinase
MAGALAEQGASLEEIITELRAASESLGSIGVCLSPCSLPGQPPLFSLGPDEIELGLGVHGEAGVERMKVKYQYMKADTYREQRQAQLQRYPP